MLNVPFTFSFPIVFKSSKSLGSVYPLDSNVGQYSPRPSSSNHSFTSSYRIKELSETIQLEAGFHMIATIADKKNLSDHMETTLQRSVAIAATTIAEGWFPYNRTLESGFHMIAAITTIDKIELKSISAMVVAAITTIAAIAGEWFPYDRCDRWIYFSGIAAIVAITWKST